MTCRDGGLIAVSVPLVKHRIVAGHYSIWPPGLLLYHMVLAGLDCREIRLWSYDFSTTAIVRKRLHQCTSIRPVDLLQYMPPGMELNNGGFPDDVQFPNGATEA